MIVPFRKKKSGGTLTDEEWRRIKDPLHAAAQLEGNERTRTIDSVLSDDPGLQAEVQSILEVHDRIGHALNAPGGAIDGLNREYPSLPSEEVIQVGGTYGPYRVIRLIGSGGMGHVFLGKDERLERHVALKSVAEKWVRSRTARQALLREARTLGALDHPNIATLYDVFEDPRRLLLVMEYVEGRTVGAVISEGPIPLGHALRLVIQVCESLIYAHDRGIIHCDIKPANIQVSSEGTVKMLDFGLARARFEENPDGTQPRVQLIGTPPYMAPEHLRDGSLTAAGDIYSLGVTLFEMITGRLPFVENKLPVLIGAILATEPPRVSSLAPSSPSSLDDVVARALAKDPRDRYPTVRELHRELRAVLQSIDSNAVVLPERFNVQHEIASQPRTLGVVMVTALVFLVLTFLAGFATSIAYNSLLGLTGSFAEGSLLSWTVWGLRSIVLPFGQVAVVFLGIAVANQLGRLAITALRGRRPERLLEQTRRLSRRVRGITLPVLAGVLVIAHLLALGLFRSRFNDLFEAIDNLLRNTGSVVALSLHNAEEHKWYMRAFSLLILGFGYGWYRLLKSTPRIFERVGGVTLAAGAILMLFSFLLMTVPYRLFFQSKGERASYQSNVCHIVGENGTDAVLFCPAQFPPWSLRVNLNDPNLQRTGTRESIFAR